jgi:hypothetical protein
MQNSVAFEVEYREHVRQMAWVNEHDWTWERPARKRPVWPIVAEALRALARIAAPAQPPKRPATTP